MVYTEIYVSYKATPMRQKIRDLYQTYKPYVFSDGWYYIFIIVFIALLFVFFA